MKQQIEQVLADVAARYNDRRLHVCNLRADVDEEGAVKIAGRVLEASYLEAVRQSLPPSARVASYDVTVLRADATRTVAVATNLTDLHVEPSFLSELLTQVTYGVELEVLEEQDKWVFVRQRDGYLGWAYKPYLTDEEVLEPTHIVTSPHAPLFGDPRLEHGTLITRVLGGTRVHIADEGWGHNYIRLGGRMLLGGWTHGGSLRPLASLPLKVSDGRRQMIADARQFRGTYYLWGGCSAFGIDCSGLAQLVHRLSGYTIPRDADMQFAAGRPVEGGPENFRPGDLLFFTGDHNRRKISHVGISTGGWNMIHSSRFHNGVYEDDVQQRPHLRDTFAGARTFLPPE